MTVVTPDVPADLLPANATAFERAQALTSARLLNAPVNVVRYARVGASAPKQLLGHLAWERSVHHPSDDVPTMRGRIDASFSDHLSYGSPAALEQEIALDTGVAVFIKEFWQVAGGQWPDFYVCVAIGPGHPAPPDPAALRAAALRRKNVRDWPIVRFEALSEPAAAVVAVGLQVRLKVSPLPVDGRVRQKIAPRVGVALIVKIRAKVLPR